MAWAKTVGRDPSVVVAPLSCCRQWMSEIDVAFGNGMKAMQVVVPGMLPADLFKYDVVVTSYHYVSAELAKINPFRRKVARYR
jgi:hypothetical protein